MSEIEPAELPDERPRSTAVRELDGDRRDRDAAARDDRAERADHAAAERDRRAEQFDADASSCDPTISSMRSGRARRAAAQDRMRAAADRAAARSDRDASAQDRRRSALDDLTGTYRRDTGLTELGRDFDDAARTGQSMVIGFLDVDGLKVVNDRHGHAAGDEILRRVAATVRTHLRRGDILVRYGGDKFVFSVLGLDESAVRECLDAEEATLRVDGAGTITCGIALAAGADSITAAIERADADLYRRRRTTRSGRNSGPESEPVDPSTNRDDPSRHRSRGLLHVADEFDRPSDASTAGAFPPAGKAEVNTADVGGGQVEA